MSTKWILGILLLVFLGSALAGSGNPEEGEWKHEIDQGKSTLSQYTGDKWNEVFSNLRLSFWIENLPASISFLTITKALEFSWEINLRAMVSLIIPVNKISIIFRSRFLKGGKNKSATIWQVEDAPGSLKFKVKSAGSLR